MNGQISPETAHPKAKKLLAENFYWSPIEESGPFGSDDGSDAFYGFRQWRSANPTTSPIVYLEELIERWGYPRFDWNALDTVAIHRFLSVKSKTDEEAAAILEQFKTISSSGNSELSEAQIQEMVNELLYMGNRYMLGQDNAIIATGFGQFVLEGRIDNDIQALTQTAIQRELLPILIDRWEIPYKNTRVEQLTKMLLVLDKMNE